MISAFVKNKASIKCTIIVLGTMHGVRSTSTEQSQVWEDASGQEGADVSLGLGKAECLQKIRQFVRYFQRWRTEVHDRGLLCYSCPSEASLHPAADCSSKHNYHWWNWAEARFPGVCGFIDGTHIPVKHRPGTVTAILTGRVSPVYVVWWYPLL